ncbi:hypothetical protein QFZ23_001716 [Arthrobacter globiformis]|nr:hypothetical protein [Arthrobacter globiformis]
MNHGIIAVDGNPIRVTPIQGHPPAASGLPVTHHPFQPSAVGASAGNADGGP